MSGFKNLENTKTFIAANRTMILLLLILAVGAWLRFAGATWGLPLRLHVDEKYTVNNAITMANAHRFEVTGNFNTPDHTPIKLQVLGFWVMRHTITAVSIARLSEEAVAASIAQFEEVPPAMQKLPPKARLFMLNCSRQHPIAFGRANDDSLYVSAGRALSALFGVICIFLAWLIGNQIHKHVGIICALLFALFPDFIERSHYITPEIYQTAFTLGMTYFAIIYAKHPKYKTLFLACLCAALAFCTKYPALFSFPIVIAAVIYANSRGLRKQKELNPVLQMIWKNIYTCVIAFVLFGISVVAISPILLLDLSSVYMKVMFEARSTHLGADGFGFWGNLFFYLKCYAKHSGIIMAAFTVFGFMRLYKENRLVFLLLCVGVLYAPIISKLALHWDRWGVPFYAFAVIFASVGMWKALEWLKSIYSEFIVQREKMSKMKWALSLVVVGLFVVAFSNLFWGSVAKTIRFSVAQDTRSVSGDYVSTLGATENNTFYEGGTPFKLTGAASIFGDFEGMDISKPSNPELKYIILSSGVYSRYYAEPDRYKEQIAFYEALKANKTILREFVPVKVTESPNDIKNIVNSLKAVVGFLKGGYSGPALTFYEY